MLAILGIYSGGAVWVLSLLELSLAVWLILKKGKFFSFKLEKGEIWLAAIFFVLGVKRVALALFYPFSAKTFGLQLILLIPQELRITFLAALDAVFLIFWLFWMEFKLKISEYF